MASISLIKLFEFFYTKLESQDVTIFDEILSLPHTLDVFVCRIANFISYLLISVGSKLSISQHEFQYLR